MSEIIRIEADKLREMKGKEGLIFPGCAPPFQDWLDGINDMLTEANILLDGRKFDKIMVFQNDGCTNLLFPLDEVNIDLEKLAVWRIKTQEVFAGKWLSDYVPNMLDGFYQPEETHKIRPKMDLACMDGNIFNIMGKASALLKQNKQHEEAKEMADRVMSSGGYEEALHIISEYVDTGLSAHLATDMNRKKVRREMER